MFGLTTGIDINSCCWGIAGQSFNTLSCRHWLICLSVSDSAHKSPLNRLVKSVCLILLWGALRTIDDGVFLLLFLLFFWHLFNSRTFGGKERKKAERSLSSLFTRPWINLHVSVFLMHGRHAGTPGSWSPAVLHLCPDNHAPSRVWSCCHQRDGALSRWEAARPWEKKNAWQFAAESEISVH